MNEHSPSNVQTVFGARGQSWQLYSSRSVNALRSAYNNSLKSFVAVLLTRTHGFAAGRLARRYMHEKAE